ncbi:hypothetical protein JTE90_008027 [Oedothorax gibbosus]|uniref:Uncharacterized protein n=1 Tax=Oedothorax gibbosus TaxID=931172 RepID=A0AAV6UXB5_9ARAC|nr:hypothetical protein JTE90_008027 [Oedothorax gibbosus]
MLLYTYAYYVVLRQMGTPSSQIEDQCLNVDSVETISFKTAQLTVLLTFIPMNVSKRSSCWIFSIFTSVVFPVVLCVSGKLGTNSSPKRLTHQFIYIPKDWGALHLME